MYILEIVENNALIANNCLYHWLIEHPNPQPHPTTTHTQILLLIDYISYYMPSIFENSDDSFSIWCKAIYTFICKHNRLIIKVIDNIKAQDVPMNQLSYLHACLPTCMPCSHLFTLYGLRDNIISGTGTFKSKDYLPSPVNQIKWPNVIIWGSQYQGLCQLKYTCNSTGTPNWTDVKL